MQKRRAEEILNRLRDNFSVPEWASGNRDPYRTLILTVLSQATADTNSARAFRNLQKRFTVTPDALSEAETEELENTIRVGGFTETRPESSKRSPA